MMAGRSPLAARVFQKSFAGGGGSANSSPRRRVSRGPTTNSQMGLMTSNVIGGGDCDSGRDSQLSGDVIYARPPSEHFYFKITDGKTEFL